MTTHTLTSSSVPFLTLRRRSSASAGPSQVGERTPSVAVGRSGWQPGPQLGEGLWPDQAMLTALADRDGRWAARSLGLEATSIIRPDLLIVTWLLRVAAVGIIENHHRERPHAEAALAVLRRLVRSALEPRAADRDTAWVMPSGLGEIDRTIAYLLVACLRMRDIDARPWLWAGQPEAGRCLRCDVALRADGDLQTISMRPVAYGHHLSLLRSHPC